MLREHRLIAIVFGASLLLLSAAGCASDEAGADEVGDIGLRFDYVEAEGCSLPSGSLPRDITLLELSVFRTDDEAEIQTHSLLVDPLARCADDDGQEFSCPFDHDRDGKRERYFALDPVPVDIEVRVIVSMKDARSQELWGGFSDPVTVAASGATVVRVALRSKDAACSAQ